MKIKHIFFIILPLMLVAMAFADGNTSSKASDTKAKTTVNTTCEKPCTHKADCPHGDKCTCGDTCKADSTCNHAKPDNCPKKASVKDTPAKKATTAIKCDPSKCAGCKGHK